MGIKPENGLVKELLKYLAYLNYYFIAIVMILSFFHSLILICLNLHVHGFKVQRKIARMVLFLLTFFYISII